MKECEPLVSGVPRMTIERTDLMRRFITFIDVMYEHKVRWCRLTLSNHVESAWD